MMFLEKTCLDFYKIYQLGNPHLDQTEEEIFEVLGYDPKDLPEGKVLEGTRRSLEKNYGRGIRSGPLEYQHFNNVGFN